MSAPPPHVSRANERTVLQSLTLTTGLSLVQLYRPGSNLSTACWRRLDSKPPDDRTLFQNTEE